MVIGTSLAIPRHSKYNPDGFLKYLSVGVRGLLPTRVSKRHSGKMQTSAAGSCRASMIFPLIEQVIVVEVGLILIASEACFASFDQSIVGVWQKILSSDS